MAHEHTHEHGCSCGHEHHHHEHDCNCGHEHHHHHEHDCNCGHEHHHHDHECSCGCGHHHRDPRPITEQALAVEVNGNELAILKTVEAVGCLPVARFIATNSEEEEVVIDCLSPVYLYDTTDTMEEVKAIGAVLQGLEDKGLMSLDYDMPIVDFDYSMYVESDLYAYFEKTMLEAQGREGFLCDTAGIELGSMAVTELGAQVCAREE